MKILIDTSPLHSGHAIRGIGMYTRFLMAALAETENVELIDQKHRQEAELIHYPFFDFFAPTLPINRKQKTVVTIHDCVPLLFPKFYPSGVKGKIFLTRQKWSLRSVDAVITDSQAASIDIVEKLPVKGNQIYPIHLAANPEIHFLPMNTFAHLRRQLKLPKKYVLYVGDINYNKNLPQLIKAMKFLPEEIQLVCVGKNFVSQPIPEWKAIEQQLALSDMIERTHFLTKIAADDTEHLSAIYQAALVYVQPSVYEGFGLPVLEAMRCRVPVVASQRGSLPEISDHHAVLVEPDAEALANGIKEVLEWRSSERMNKVIAAESWQEQFTWQKTALQTADVYRQVLERG